MDAHILFDDSSETESDMELSSDCHIFHSKSPEMEVHTTTNDMTENPQPNKTSQKVMLRILPLTTVMSLCLFMYAFVYEW